MLPVGMVVLAGVGRDSVNVELGGRSEDIHGTGRRDSPTAIADVDIFVVVVIVLLDHQAGDPGVEHRLGAHNPVQVLMAVVNDGGVRSGRRIAIGAGREMARLFGDFR